MNDIPKLFRAVEVIREKAGDGKESVSLSVSSETPCLNYIAYERRYQFGNVILSHADGAINDTYIRDGIVLRDNHEGYGGQKGEVVARAMDVKVEDGKLRAGKIVWSASDRAQILKADVENGVRREMSIEATFSSKDVERIDKGDEEKGVYPTFRVKRWTPLAAAFVPVPADPSVGINRGAETEPKPEAPEVTPPPSPTAEVSAERSKMDKETPAGTPAEKTETAAPAIDVARMKDEIRNELKDELKREAEKARIEAARAQAPKPEAPKELGLDDKDIAKYSIANAIRAKIDNRDCFELEVSREACKKLGKESRGIYIPEEILMKRAFDTTAGTGLIGTEHRAADFITVLRNALIFDRLGVQVLPGLRGNVSIPKQTGSATTQWVTEGNAPAASAPSVGNVTLTPHDLACYVPITRSALMQSLPIADGIVQADMIAGMRHGLQKAFFHGTGSSGQPTGLASILTTASREFDVATPGSETYAELIGAEGMVIGKGLGGIKWAVSARALTAMRGLLRSTYGDKYLADLRSDDEGEIIGRTALFTDDITAAWGFIGDFSQALFGMWGGLDLLVDPYTEAPSGTIRIVTHQDADFAVRHADAFAFSDELVGA
jgi:HK97 family phage major capsid protein